jgi:hypothetical protein
MVVIIQESLLKSKLFFELKSLGRVLAEGKDWVREGKKALTTSAFMLLYVHTHKGAQNGNKASLDE